ncbi:MAG: hypothetical protein PHO02_00075 [Candidatus Nanoarchaeia archaeon]|nr:hypothetical protein [Candidatus Nanoarchaeia archaeon]
MKKILMIAFALVMLLSIASPMASAQNVDVGLYILNLGKFDISTGSFTADFYLSMKCDNECSDFEFVNGRATSVDRIIDEPNEKFYRIQAALNSPVDLKSFPFDSQKMQIILEDKENTIDKLAYVPIGKESGIDESIAFTGWNIDRWEASVAEHYYKPYDETYSQYVFNVDISRIVFNSFLKTFLPVFFIMMVTMFSFVLDPDKITTRLGMAGSSLVAAVMFHIAISNQIPPVGYLTLADKFMVLTYFILLVTFILNVIMLELHERKQEAKLMRMHRLTEFSMLGVVPLVYVLFFVLAFIF